MITERRHWTRAAVAFATRLVVLTCAMLMAVASLAMIETIVLWRAGITYTPKCLISDIGIVDFMLVDDGRWGVSRVFYRPAGLNQSCAWEVLLHDMQRSGCVQCLYVSQFKPQIMSASPSGNRLALGSMDGTIRLWDGLQTSSPPRVIKDACNDTLTALVYSPNEEWLVAAGQKTLYGWRSTTGELIYKLEHACGGKFSLSFSHDSTKLMFFGSDNRLQLYDIERRERIEVIIAGVRPMLAATLSPNGKTALASTIDGVVRVVDLERGSEPLKQLPSRWLVFS